MDNRDETMTLQNVMEELKNQCNKYPDKKFTHRGSDSILIGYQMIRNESDENNFMHTVIECYANDNVLEMTIDAKSMEKDGKNVLIYIAYIIDSDYYIIELMPDMVSFVSDLAPMFEASFLQYLQDNIIELMLEQGYSL